MGTTFRPYQPKQTLLLPPDLREWVPEGHLVHQVSELVDGLVVGASTSLMVRMVGATRPRMSALMAA